jgi:hypothetical protein
MMPHQSAAVIPLGRENAALILNSKRETAMGVNEPRKFVVRAKDPAQVAAEKKKPAKSPGEMLAAHMPGIMGVVLIAVGIFVMVGLSSSAASYWTTRAGLLLVGIGISSLGYWAFANKSEGYNF